MAQTEKNNPEDNIIEETQVKQLTQRVTQIHQKKQKTKKNTHQKNPKNKHGNLSPSSHWGEGTSLQQN